MPPGSRTIDEEGVLIEDFRLVERGRLREAEVAELLTSAPWPVRDLAQNLADLRAQVAANARGVAELERMVGEFGVPVVAAYMRHVQDNAEEAVRRAIGRLHDGAWRQEMDDGSVIAVSVTIDRAERSAVIDFTGTSPQRGDNFNAPAAVCTAAVLYVFRTLVDADIPLNAGCLKPLRIVVPPGSMLDPAYPAAVAAGNVETSQAITNALFGALGVVAASQGTMNNVTFGDARYQYYETVCGGAGAGPGFDGCSGVHTHMTNSRLTDPEVLEARFPVRVEEFALRRGSGGAGVHRGGDGVVRRLRFLEPLTAAVVASGRRVPPYGLAGGLPGAAGHDFVVRAGGEVEELPGVAEVQMCAGDELVDRDARRRRLRRAAGTLTRCGATLGVALASARVVGGERRRQRRDHLVAGRRQPDEDRAHDLLARGAGRLGLRRVEGHAALETRGGEHGQVGKRPGLRVEGARRAELLGRLHPRGGVAGRLGEERLERGAHAGRAGAALRVGALRVWAAHRVGSAHRVTLCRAA